MIGPTDLLHPSPAPHFKTFQAFLISEGWGGGVFLEEMSCRRVKDNRQNFFRHFRRDILKFETFKELFHKDSQTKNAQWKCSITTDERLAWNVMFVHMPYNLLSPSSSEQLNTSQNAVALWLTIFVNVRVVSGRDRIWTGRAQAVDRRPMLIHTCHADQPCLAVPWPWEVSFSAAWSEHGKGTAWHFHWDWVTIL